MHLIPATVYELLRHTRYTASAAAISCMCLLPIAGLQKPGLAKFVACGLGALSAAAGYLSYEDNRKLYAISRDLEAVDRSYHIQTYHQALQEPAVPLLAPAAETNAIEPITDVVQYWQAEDKHLLIVGGTGAGKSTFIQAFASKLSSDWQFHLYDTDCTVDDWEYLRSRNSCFFEALEDIEQRMTDDLPLLEQRMKERKKAGNSWETNPLFIVAEEFPLLVGDIKIASTWLRKLAKRGRRTKMFMAVVAQNSTVSNLGLNGDSNLRDSCFVVVLLGTKAIERAKELKDPTLVQWLQQGKKDVCLVDDKPALRPR